MKRLENRLNSITELCELSGSQDVNTDIILTLCGKKIGSGSSRSVYEFNMDPKKLVVKIEGETLHNPNLVEYWLWDEIRGLKGSLAWVKQWFAPIRFCSPNGRILIMERTSQDGKKERPNKIPEFFSDVHINNFGWLNGKFVCHDYGFLYKFVKYEKKFQNVKWY